jgi:hypothetical protein
METGILHEVIREHLDEFLRAAADRADGTGLPEFITREFREFLTCCKAIENKIGVPGKPTACQKTLQSCSNALTHADKYIERMVTGLLAQIMPEF